jgi:hypothetical protein
MIFAGHSPSTVEGTPEMFSDNQDGFERQSGW